VFVLLPFNWPSSSVHFVSRCRSYKAAANAPDFFFFFLIWYCAVAMHVFGFTVSIVDSFRRVAVLDMFVLLNQMHSALWSAFAFHVFLVLRMI
jgi:hypothetical protein